ncbi:MAG: hypothetical protein V5A47_12095 [Bacteroidales bacterium]
MNDYLRNRELGRREDGRRREDGKTGKGEDEKTRTVNMKRREEED